MDYEPSYKEFATIFKALSDETRLRVIDMLSCKEMSACDILSNFTLSQSTLSYHMKILIEAGVVDARREGLWTKYSINDDTFNRLVDKGNTVIVIEHNLDVIKLADYIIDMGPEGGRGGGQLLSTGTPEEVAKSSKGYTPRFIKEELKN